MGLLDQVIGGMGGIGGGASAPQRPGLGDTVTMGVVLALLVKAVRSYQASHPAAGQAAGRSFDPAADAGGGGMMGGLGGLGGMLGGMLGAGGGGGLGGMLSGLGGAGALGGLISHLQQSGLGGQANSWVSSAPNQPVSPQQLEAALGENTVQSLQQQTGLPRQGLLQELSHLLPEAINEATPGGRLPTDAELNQIASQPGGLRPS